MLNKCMYCQHEYGTKWKNNRGKYHERIATKDHITPIDKNRTSMVITDFSDVRKYDR